MPIVKRAWDRPFGKSESFFSFVPTMSFWTGQQQSWHWHQVLEWTIIQLFSIQFYSRMMTAVVHLQEDIIKTLFIKNGQFNLFNPLSKLFANEFPHFYFSYIHRSYFWVKMTKKSWFEIFNKSDPTIEITTCVIYVLKITYTTNFFLNCLGFIFSKKLFSISKNFFSIFFLISYQKKYIKSVMKK